MTDKIAQQAGTIKLLILDVDGVLTDGRLYFDNLGNEMKTFSTLDGHGIKLLQRAGVKVGIITGRTSDLVARRARDLGIELIIQGREDKWAALSEQLPELGIAPEHIACMGDDWPDLAIMTRVGLALSVPNAHPAVIERAHWVSQRQGGGGAVREACDMIMQAQNSYQAALAAYLP
ncbi:MAG TPA: HAD family hydrolase [Cellvibrionaceae bacterium]